MAAQPPPEQFAHLVNLAADITGTFAVDATDDFFAPREALLRPWAPEWREGEYTDRGKWMDGWESQRKREPGHDHCTLRLGTPGRVHGLLVDTTHFKGNAPQAVWLETTEAPFTATPRDLAAASWTQVLPRTQVKPDFPNVVPLPAATARATHVRLHIDPDGGVARLRVYGEVVPDERTFWREGTVDLAAVENGGTIAAASDSFFGPPANLLLPGRGVNMGDGWETRRRRTPGSDWCAIKLARRALLDRLELDTHFFKGNAPQAVLVEALDAQSMDGAALETRLRAPDGWSTLVGKTALVQHRRHILEPDRPMMVTHLRVHIFPHGGVNRLRAFGVAVDGPVEQGALARLHGLSDAEARTTFASFNGSKAWVSSMLKQRPFPSVRALFAASEATWWSLGHDDWLEAYAAHPRIGQTKKAETATEQSATWSKGEQRGVESAADETRARLAALNDVYVEKYGFIFICFATGRTAAQMLELLEQRVENPREVELENAAREQAKITRLRLEKWVNGR
jgi:allantoicase